jgi:hypothetical protein
MEKCQHYSWLRRITIKLNSDKIKEIPIVLYVLKFKKKTFSLR